MNEDSFADAPTYHHPVIITERGGITLGIGLADEEGHVRGLCFLDLEQAEEFGRLFCTRFNEQLLKWKELVINGGR